MGVIFSTRGTGSVENNKKNNENKKVIFSNKKIIEELGHSSLATRVGNMLFCGNILGINPETNKLSGKSIGEETRQLCRNISSVLEENKTSLKNVVKTTVYLKNMSNLELVDDIYKDYFILKPTRSIVGVHDLPMGANIAIEVIAEVE